MQSAINSITKPPTEPRSDQQIRRGLERLKPWRMSIQINDEVNTHELLELAGQRDNDCHKSRNKFRNKFLRLVDTIYPEGMLKKRFLDCGCNAGGHCFWARERQSEISFGFDVREHWIRQAKFVRYHMTATPKNRIQFEIINLYDLPSWDLDPFDLVYFKNLFYHLPDPIAGLKIAADFSKDVIYFSSAFSWEQADGALIADPCDNEMLHGGTDRMKWLPTGPGICGELIKNLGFEEVKLTFQKQIKARPERGRLEIVAARDKGRLSNLEGTLL